MTTPAADTEPRPADGAPLLVQLFTVEASAYGPYVGLPLKDPWGPYDAHLFTRATAELIVRDLEHDECGMEGHFTPDGTLVFQWTVENDGVGGSRSVQPDAHGRYAIGELWSWDAWNNDIPQTAGQAAFAVGAAEYELAAEKRTPYPEGLDGLYARGREEALTVSLRRGEL
ncbi:hypothetical protein ACFUJY_29680 [Streptomyces sp. NPDC057249]|uniref:hypothetical protein n=1 Tax=Streptomyces sp. NPDC057249 TaxID=3346067 RepID=UPI0036400B6A